MVIVVGFHKWAATYCVDKVHLGYIIKIWRITERISRGYAWGWAQFIKAIEGTELIITKIASIPGALIENRMVVIIYRRLTGFLGRRLRRLWRFWSWIQILHTKLISILASFRIFTLAVVFLFVSDLIFERFCECFNIVIFDVLHYPILLFYREPLIMLVNDNFLCPFVKFIKLNTVMFTSSLSNFNFLLNTNPKEFLLLRNGEMNSGVLNYLSS
jgi:hypothetical protein